MVHSVSSKTYSERAASHANPAAKRLLELMDRKQTNLCVSVDVTTTQEVLEIVKAVGPSVCMVKTHCDIIEDFTIDFAKQLEKLSEEMDFMIFEDRKFADIGNTVTLQYSSGVHRISSWSHVTNAHPLPGPGIISGLASVGKPLGRGLLLLAEMSSAGNLATGQYTETAVEMARKDRDFVIGFISMKRLGDDDEDFLVLTPGVGLESKGDAMGQQYRTPTQVIKDSECDVIIVGRGIYKVKGEENVRNEAEKYRQQGWQAYKERLA